MSRQHKGVLAAVMVLLIAVLVGAVGCGSTTTTGQAATTQTTASATTQTTASATTQTGGAKPLFAECSPVASNQHQMAFTYGRKQMCDILGADFITTDANLSSTKMVADMESFMLRKVNGIMTSLFDPVPPRPCSRSVRMQGSPS